MPASMPKDFSTRPLQSQLLFFQSVRGILQCVILKEKLCLLRDKFRLILTRFDSLRGFLGVKRPFMRVDFARAFGCYDVSARRAGLHNIETELDSIELYTFSTEFSTPKSLAAVGLFGIITSQC